MAKDITGNPWVFDTATESEGFANRNESTAPNITTNIFINRIKVDTGDGGDVAIDNDATPTRRIIKADSTPANDTLEWPIGHYVDGIYITTLPTNATITVWHGMEFNK
jgi:hypothetical protein